LATIVRKCPKDGSYVELKDRKLNKSNLTVLSVVLK
jgi:hypothetical protein